MAENGPVSALREQLEEIFQAKMREQPRLTTINGDIEWDKVERAIGAGSMEKRTGGHDNDTEVCAWVEYWRGGTLIHRSAHVHLKKPTALAAGAVQGF